MIETTLAEAYRTGSIVAGDLLSIKTGEDAKKYIYLVYLKGRSLHHLVPYPVSEYSCMTGVFCKDDDIKEWEKVGHITPEELKKEINSKK